MEQSEIDAINRSFGKCSLNSAFLDTFYELFLTSDPTVKQKFANTDVVKQKKVLMNSLHFMIMFASNSSIAKNELTRTARTHSKYRFDITPNLYPFWVNSLIKTIYKFDEKMSTELEMIWRRALQKGVNYLISFYD